MAKLYFLGGENIDRQDSRAINEKAFLDAGGAPSVVVFPWAREGFDKAYVRRTMLSNYFLRLGASAVDFADYSDTPEEIARKVDGSNLIYLTGGYMSVLLERLKFKRVDNLLRNYDGVIVGRSAGALALCNKGILTKKRRKPDSVVLAGLGLVDFNVKVHYKPWKDAELKRLSREDAIYAIPHRSALVCDGDVMSFMGRVYLFEDGEKTLIDSEHG